MEYRVQYRSPLGTITLGSDGTALTGLWFDGQKYFLAPSEETVEGRELPVFAETRRWLDAYFAGAHPERLPALAPQGTAFRQAVWEILRTIPYGQTITYGAIASRLAARGQSRMSAQAVGGAVGHNPISILIPCHRVVGADGSLTGYAGGVERKRQLLLLEGVSMEHLFVPSGGTALG